MAAGKTGYVDFAGTKGFSFRLHYSETYDIVKNTSDLTPTKIQVKSDDYSGYWHYLNGTISIAGIPVATMNSMLPTHRVYLSSKGTWLDCTGPLDAVKGIAHGSDGSKKITISVNVNGYTVEELVSSGHNWGVSGSTTISLTTIPRASKLDSVSCATTYFTGGLTYKYTPQSSALYNRCNISLNLDGDYIAVKSINLGKKAASQQTATVTLTAAELETIYNKLPSATKGVLRFTLRTYSDSDYNNQAGDASYKEITLNIPNDTTTQATVSMSLAPVGSLPSAFSGLYVQGRTKVKATLSAEGKFKSTIKSYSMKVESSTYDSGDSYTSDYLNKTGSVPVTGYAKDSRGYKGSTSKDITVIAYSKPQLGNVEAVRCDANGNASDTGTYLKIKAKRIYAPVKSGGVQKNFCLIRFRYKLESAASYSGWTTILARDSLSSDTVQTGALLGGVLSTKSTYKVQIQAVDDIGEKATTTVDIMTETVYMHRTKNAMGLGKYVEEENLLDVAWDTHLRGEVRIGADGKTLREYILAVISEGG